MDTGLYGFPTPGGSSPLQLVSQLPPISSSLHGQQFLLAATVLSSTGYRDAILATSGLTNYWKLDETSGTTVIDSKGTRNGTYSGSYTLAQSGAIPDIGNSSVQFLSGSANITNGSADWVGGAMSMECWYYTTSTSNQAIFGIRNDSNADFYVDILNSTQYECRFRNSSGTVLTLMPTPGAINAWHHLVMTYNGSTTFSVYLDGALAAQTTSVSGTITNTTQAMTIAKDTSGPFFQGRIDEVAVYNVAISPGTILNHYLLGSASAHSERLYIVRQASDGTYQYAQVTLT